MSVFDTTSNNEQSIEQTILSKKVNIIVTNLNKIMECSFQVFHSFIKKVIMANKVVD